jgi:P4 family phage/plasmid primase-like protien
MVVIKLVEKVNQDLINNVINCSNIPDENNIQVILRNYTGKVTYSQIKNFGRYYAKGGLSLQSFQKDIRKYLSNGNYVDIDIVNCHPVILEQLFVKYSLEVPEFLSEYNLNREQTIKKYNLQDKLDFLKKINTETIGKVHENILDCHQAIYLKLLPVLVLDYKVPKTDKIGNINGSIFAKIMQHIENDILQIMFKKCKELKVKVGVLVFDGMMIEKENLKIEVPKLLKNLEQEVQEKLGYSIKLAEKSMDTDWKPEFSEKNIDKKLIKEEYTDLVKENFDHSLYDYQLTEKNISSTLNNILIKKLICQCQDANHSIHVDKTGYCSKCNLCLMQFPKNSSIAIPEKYPNIINYFNVTINNNTTNYLSLDGSFSINFKCQINENIFNDNKMTYIINDCIEEAKTYELSKLLHYIYKEHIWTGETWYYFNGYKWINDFKKTQLKRVIMEKIYDEILKDKILAFYYNEGKNLEHADDIIKAVRFVRKKLNELSFIENIINLGNQFFENLEFFNNLNSKKNIIPFNNGIYDLTTNTFRNGERTDYIELLFNYPYDNTVSNSDVYTFIEQILPDKSIRDYVLKRFSDCLNGDIENTNFLFFIGNEGANGKSQLLNLMKITMDEFAEKMEVALLTRKRTDANQANTEKIKLHNKRFAFFSEPEDGEKINIGLFKEMTSGEEITARDLYKSPITFKIQSKFFLACNELPEIKGEDTALWRRISVVEFKSKFVDEPKHKNEYKIDRTLSTKMRDDLSWRQTFMNILIEYYNRKDIKEPEEVKVYTNKYRKDNDMNLDFVGKYIKEEENGFVLWTDLWKLYQEWYYEMNGNNNNLKKLQVKKYFIEKIFKINEKKFHKGWGWSNFSFKTVEK